MSLARALTKRMRSQEEVSGSEKSMSRAFSTRKFDKPIDRSKISLPLELISSTNALAYDAPDIAQINAHEVIVDAKPMPPTPTITTTVPRSPSSSSSASSTKSYQDSMKSPALSSASSVTSNEASRESSPVVADHKPETFLLEKEETRPKSVKESLAPAAKVEEDLPNVPQRALSHTKKTHQALARQRSQRISSPPPQPRTSVTPVTRSSMDMFSAKPEADHPFGAELQKVNELAEEFGMKDVQILDEESQYLIDNGFHRFSADDYIQEIQPLFIQAYPAPVTWL